MNISFILDFLTDLRDNNHKEWMDTHKKRYLEAKGYFAEIIETLIADIHEFDPSLIGAEPKNSIFRINRDIRFSKNKNPYKTNFGGDMSPHGKKSPYAGYYLQLEPGNVMVAGGNYMPEAKLLAKIRQEIDYSGADLQAIIDNPAFVKNFGELQGDKLVRPPKGYDKEHEHIELLKRKGFIAVKYYSDKEAISPGFLEKVVSDFKVMQPMNAFLNLAVEE